MLYYAIHVSVLLDLSSGRRVILTEVTAFLQPQQ